MSTDCLACNNRQHIDLPTYQHAPLMEAIRAAIRPHLAAGDFIIWRDAFRWKDDNGHVLPNHYEMFGLWEIAGSFGYEVVHDFCHVAVVKHLPKESA